MPGFNLAAPIGLVGAACAGASGQLILSDFDDASGLWRYDFGLTSSNVTISHDSALDADSDPLSGSMRVDMVFDVGMFGTDNKGAITLDLFPAIDASQFATFEADIFVSPNSVQDAFGNYGYAQFAIRNTGSYNYRSEPGRNLSPAGQWVHISIPTTDFAGAINEMRGVTFQLYGGPSQNMTGDVTFWLDNVELVPAPGAGTVVLFALAWCGRRRR